MTNSDSSAVLSAAQQLIHKFATSDKDGYFACFADSAEFIFYTNENRMYSKNDYLKLWNEWVTNDNFRVISCLSTNPKIVALGADHALFTHDVTTEISTNEGITKLLERETIVFAHMNEHWLAIHEHLSPKP